MHLPYSDEEKKIEKREEVVNITFTAWADLFAFVQKTSNKITNILRTEINNHND